MSDSFFAEKTNEPLPELLTSGLDSLYVSLSLDMSAGLIDFDDLQFRKDRMRDMPGRDFEKIELGGLAFALKPFGVHPYRFTLVNEDLEIRLTEHMQPTAYIRFSSKALWHSGLDGLEATLKDWCRALELPKFGEETVSRADFAFDFHLPLVDFDEENFVSRAEKDAKWRERRKCQTFQFGKGGVVVRVYDKSAEVEQASGKAWFYDIWGRKSEVWRIEFQVRGERLKQGGIRTFNDLRDLQADLIRELATSHTSLRVKTQDKNRSRWPLHPLWQALLTEIAKRPQTGLVRSFDPAKLMSYRQFKQGQAVYGSLKALAALHQIANGLKTAPDFKLLIGRLPTYLRHFHQPEEWEEEVCRRIEAHEVGQW